MFVASLCVCLNILNGLQEQSSDSHVHWSAAIERLLSECGTDGLPSGDAFKTARSLFQRWTKRSGTLTGLDCVLEGIAIKVLPWIRFRSKPCVSDRFRWFAYIDAESLPLF